MSGYTCFPSLLPTPQIPVFRGHFSLGDFWLQELEKELVPGTGGVGALAFWFNETYDVLPKKPWT